MKLSKPTLDILNNFSTIYNSMRFSKGKVQRTNSYSMTLLAEANLDVEFPQEFAIFDMSTFLGMLSSFTEPELDFDENFLTMHSGKQKAVYRYCNIDYISKKLIPVDKKLDLPKVDISFDISKEDLTKLLNQTKILGCTHISVFGDGASVFVQSINLQDENFHKASIEVGETDKKFNMIMSLDNLKILNHSYKVNISKSALAKFISQDAELVYTLACEKDSSFEG